jgi:hypothetical protein
MKRKSLLAALLAGLGMGLFMVVFSQPVQANPGDVLVNRATGDDQLGCGTAITPCYSIKYAVENVAVAGDQVLVAAGTYTETFSMQPGIAIVSVSGPEQTIIDGEGVRGPMVSATSSMVTTTARLEGFTVMGGNDRGINIEHASPVISDCTICANHGEWGGGIAISQAQANVLISHSRVVSNTANGDSGGIYMENNATLTLVHSTVAGNTADGWGGGVLGYGSATLTISDCTIYDNHGTYGGGIAIAQAPANALISHSQIISNTATGDGGGIWTDDSAELTLVHSTIATNTAQLWGGGVIGNGSATLTISDTLVQDNHASYGGGIMVASSDLDLLNSQFYSNTAISGGAIHVREGSTSEIHSNWISNNTGDGIYASSAAGTVENNFVIHNSLGGSEAQIRLGGNTTFTVTNNTLVGDGNSAGIRIEEGTIVAITNNIVTGNEYGIQATGLVTPTLNHNDVWDNSVANFENIAPGTNDISCDPGFVDAANNDYHLGIFSWAVDAGTNVGAPANDYDGDARPVDGDGDGTATVDIGADERLTVTTRIHLPLVVHAYP